MITAGQMRADAVAGLTVAVVALPLASLVTVLVLVTGVRPQPREVMVRMGLGTGSGGHHDNLCLAANFAEAREMAAAMIESGVAQ